MSDNKDFDKLLSDFSRGAAHKITPGHNVHLPPMPCLGLTCVQAVAMARRLLECAGVQPAIECPGHGRGGLLEPCCDRAGEYNGFGSDGPTVFDCPKQCSCHD